MLVCISCLFFLSLTQRLPCPLSQVGVLVTLTFSIVATAVLTDLWGEEWETLLLSFQVTLVSSEVFFSGFFYFSVILKDFSRLHQITAPYLHVGGVLLLTVLAWPIALHFCRLKGKGGVFLNCCLYCLSLMTDIV